MSLSRLVVVHCDVCGRAPLFDGWGPTAVESRSAAKHEGYRKEGTLDICPECDERDDLDDAKRALGFSERGSDDTQRSHRRSLPQSDQERKNRSPENG